MWQNIYDLFLLEIHVLISGNILKLLVDRILQVFTVQNLIFQRETSYQKIPTNNAMAQIYRRSNKILLCTIPTVIKRNYRQIKKN